MMERRRIVELWKKDPAGVLVTLVRVEGSSYRRTGARLLTAAAGVAGTISGGCLEADVVRRAAWIARSGATVERYATTFDDTSDMPFGLGCGGTVDLLFEPMNTPEAAALMLAAEVSLAGMETTVVHFLPDATRCLRRLILNDAGEILFASAGLSAEKIACARGLIPGGEYDGRFVERLEAPQRLFVFGAGDDAKPLVEIAAMLGWSVTVADGRAHLAKPGRFLKSDHVAVVCTKDGVGDGVGDFGIGERDAVVLMTHSYEQDRELLVRMLPDAPRYLGLLGSRHRSSLLISETAAELGLPVETCCERVFAPVGMDLGGDGPEAIALAVVAEVQAVCHGRIGSPRRLGADEVAEQIAQGGSSKYLQAQCAV